MNKMTMVSSPVANGLQNVTVDQFTCEGRPVEYTSSVTSLVAVHPLTFNLKLTAVKDVSPAALGNRCEV
jgi:hypothetical protein